MNITEAIENANKLYKRYKKAHVRRGGSETPLDYSGKMVGSDRPIGLVVLRTKEPATKVPIVDWDEDEDGPPPADRLTYEALSELAGIASFKQGVAGILWLNAGLPAMLGSEHIVNLARSYQTALDREENGQSAPERQKQVHWDQFSTLQVERATPQKGKALMAVDWLAAARGAVTQVDGEGEAAGGQSESSSEGDDGAETPEDERPDS